VNPTVQRVIRVLYLLTILVLGVFATITWQRLQARATFW
jgi:hypothetical protein